LIGRIRFGVWGGGGRFVWRGNGLEALEFFERSIKGPLDAGFVTGEFLDGAAAAVILEKCRGLTLGFRQ